LAQSALVLQWAARHDDTPVESVMSDLRIEAFTSEIEARDPETYAEVLRLIEAGVPEPVGRLDARTIAAIVVAMDTDGRIDVDLFEPSQ
jgi:hypothetical protein